MASKLDQRNLAKLEPGKMHYDDQRGSGVAYYRFSDGDGGMFYARVYASVGKGKKRPFEKIENCAGIVEARDVARSRRSDAFRGTYQPKIAVQKITLDGITDRFLKTRQGKPIQAKYRRDIENHLSPALGKQALVALTPDRLRRYRSARLAAEAAPATVHNELACLRALLAFAQSERIVETNAVSELGLEQPDNARKRHISPAEEAALFAAAAKLSELDLEGALGELYWHVLWNTGMRANEALSVRPAHDIDWTHKIIRVRGKGDKRREVPIVKRLRPRLQAWIAAHDGDEYLFTRSTGERMNYWAMERVWDLLLSTAKVRDLNPHDLRHRCADWLISSGMAPHVVMRAMGWSSWQMLKRYTEAADERMREAFAELDEQEETPKNVRSLRGRKSA